MVGPSHFGRILVRKQQRIGPRDGQPRRAAFEGRAHSVVQPAGGPVEGRIGCETVAHQGRFVVGIQGRHEGCAGAVRLLGDAARQRHRLERRGHHQFLPGVEAKSNFDRYPCQLIELLFKSKCLRNSRHHAVIVRGCTAVPPPDSQVKWNRNYFRSAVFNQPTLQDSGIHVSSVDIKQSPRIARPMLPGFPRQDL